MLLSCVVQRGSRDRRCHGQELGRSSSDGFDAEDHFDQARRRREGSLDCGNSATIKQIIPFEFRLRIARKTPSTRPKLGKNIRSPAQYIRVTTLARPIRLQALSMLIRGATCKT
jgi:hypothetical protein